MRTVGNLLNNGFGEGTVTAGALRGAQGLVENSKLLGMGNKVDIQPEDIVNAIEQYLGVAPNPNPSVLFQGPVLREFNFSWMFNPRNAEESRRLKKIISKMKASTLPATSFGSDTGLLRYPNVAMVNFFPWDNSSSVSNGSYGWSDESFMRIKRCVIENIITNYAPSGAPTFFEGTKDPVFIQMNITLKEIEFFVSEDWGGEKDVGLSEAGDGFVGETYESLKGLADEFKESFSDFKI